MMAYTQENRLISIDTPLGKDVLLLQELTGHEGISGLFSFDLNLLSENPSISFDRMVGQRVTLTMIRADGSPRYINGFVSRFAQSGSDARFAHYQAKVVPWLWFLSRTADCRIFQKMTVPDILMRIFTDLGFSDFKNLLQGGFEPLEYCVQYRETDLNFVSRLMEQYGIFYFFEHGRDRHTLVLGDSPTAHPPCPGQAWVRYEPVAGALQEEDLITGWQMEQELRPGGYALADYNFETPGINLAVNVASTVNVGGNRRYEMYDYPGGYLKKPQGENLVKLRIEEEEAQHLVVRGAGTCRAFTPGYRFDLMEHYRQDMNRSYLLTEVQHFASLGESYTSGAGAGVGESYSNRFVCIPYAVPYRPPRVTPKPVVQGSQSAVVVGKVGEEIWVDRYGRVKVQFHRDRQGKRDENSSCWVRVAQNWAGKQWGAIFIPRIGQEVIVDFLEGDPDQPIITGRIYNAEQMPPYGLPANQTQSGIKSRSSKGGGPSNFNEIRFEDKKGEEQLDIHAERNLSTVVEADENHSVGHNRSTTIANHETILIKMGNRQVTLEMGNDVLTVQLGNREVNVPTGTYALKAMKVLVQATQDLTLQCGAGSININAAGIIAINGSLVKINC